MEDTNTKKVVLLKDLRYEIIRSVGSGRFGVVYKARDPTTNTIVALKILHQNDPDTRRRLEREVRLLQELDVKGICKIYDVGEYEGGLYVAMEWVEGKSLYELSPSLSIREKVRLVYKIAKALEVAHEKKIIHRDIKPSNILVYNTGENEYEPVLVDFGLACLEGMSTELIGTPAYMAPELLDPHNKPTRASDIYSLGATLYELVTGRPPYEGSAHVVLKSISAQQTVSIPSDLNPEVDPILDEIILRCMDYEPENRYQTMRELIEDLESWLADRKPKGIFVPGTEKVRRWVRRIYRKRKMFLRGLVLLGGLFFILNGLLILFYMQYIQVLRQLVEATTRNAYMLPPHNIQQEKNELRQQIEKIEKIQPFIPGFLRADAYYALGLGYMVLDNLDLSVFYLTKAHELEPSDEDISKALERAVAHRFRSVWYGWMVIPNRALRNYRKKELKKMMDSISKQVHEHTGHGYQPHMLLLLFYFLSGDRELAWNIMTKNPECDTYEECLIRSWLFTVDAFDAFEMGEYQKSKEHLNDALQYIEKVIQRSPSYPDAYIYKCGSLLLKARLATVVRLKYGQTGKETFQEFVERCDELFHDAESVCEQALMIDPTNDEAHRMLAWVYRYWADFREEMALDPLKYAKKLIRHAQLALKIHKHVDAYHLKAWGEWFVGAYSMYIYQAPKLKKKSRAFARTLFHKALYTVNTALKKWKGDPLLLYTKEKILRNLGELDLIQYRRLDLLLKGIGVGEKVVEKVPDFAEAYKDLGYMALLPGYFLFYRRADIYDLVKKSIQASDKALELRPDYVDALDNITDAWMVKGLYECLYGMEYEESFKQALYWGQKGIEINPHRNISYMYLFRAYYGSMYCDMIQGRDIHKWVKKAIQVYREQEKKQLPPDMYIVDLYLLLEQNILTGGSSEEILSVYNQLKKRYERFLTKNPKEPIRAKISEKTDVLIDFFHLVYLFSRNEWDEGYYIAIRKNLGTFKNMLTFRFLSPWLYLMKAHVELRRNGDARQYILRARKELESILQRERRDSMARFWLARTYKFEAQIEQDPAKQRTLFQAYRANMQQAIQLSPPFKRFLHVKPLF